MDDLYLAHHGIKGMHWGVRRYQKPDGSLTLVGKYRYARGSKYINEKRKEAQDNINTNRKIESAYRKNADLIRKNGAKEAMKVGFDEKTAKKSAEIISAQRERYADIGKEICEHLNVYDTKLSEIDPSAQSFKETKNLLIN